MDDIARMDACWFINNVRETNLYGYCRFCAVYAPLKGLPIVVFGNAIILLNNLYN